MGIGSLGFSEMLVIFLIILVFFGPRRFPEIARSLGHAMREFRRSLNQIQRELEDADPRSSIPGRDLLKDIRAGRPGKWLDAAGSPSVRMEGSEPGAEPVAPTKEPDPHTADADQLPMFRAGDRSGSEEGLPSDDASGADANGGRRSD